MITTISISVAVVVAAIITYLITKKKMSNTVSNQNPFYVDKNGTTVDVDTELKKIGNTSALTTTAKDTLVNAINEVKGSIPTVNYPVTSVNSKTGAVVINAADVGLPYVDNTSDANKPVSTAQQAALNLKEDKANKGVANGYASLDGTVHVPAAQIPIATASAIGGVKKGTNITIALDGTISATGTGVVPALVTDSLVINDSDVSAFLGRHIVLTNGGTVDFSFDPNAVSKGWFIVISAFEQDAEILLKNSDSSFSDNYDGIIKAGTTVKIVWYWNNGFGSWIVTPYYKNQLVEHPNDIAQIDSPSLQLSSPPGKILVIGEDQNSGSAILINNGADDPIVINGRSYPTFNIGFYDGGDGRLVTLQQLMNPVYGLGFTPENVANKGATNGYAPLVSGKLPVTHLPIATSSAIGGVKAGTNVTIAPDGTISAAGAVGGSQPAYMSDGSGAINIAGQEQQWLGRFIVLRDGESMELPDGGVIQNGWFVTVSTDRSSADVGNNYGKAFISTHDGANLGEYVTVEQGSIVKFVWLATADFWLVTVLAKSPLVEHPEGIVQIGSPSLQLAAPDGAMLVIGENQNSGSAILINNGADNPIVINGQSYPLFTIGFYSGETGKFVTLEQIITALGL